MIFIDDMMKNQFCNHKNTNDDIPKKLKKLSELKDEGIITEDEFNLKKTELLNKF